MVTLVQFVVVMQLVLSHWRLGIVSLLEHAPGRVVVRSIREAADPVAVIVILLTQ